MTRISNRMTAIDAVRFDMHRAEKRIKNADAAIGGIILSNSNLYSQASQKRLYNEIMKLGMQADKVKQMQKEAMKKTKNVKNKRKQVRPVGRPTKK